MNTKFLISRFLFRIPFHILLPCYILLFLILASVCGISHQFIPSKENIANNQFLSRAIEREIVISNRTFSVCYDYSTNIVFYVGDTNTITLKIRNANIRVYEIVGTNRTKIDGTMGGVIIMNTNFDNVSDTFYVLKALSSTNY